MTTPIHRKQCTVSSETVGELRRKGYAVVVMSREEVESTSFGDPKDVEEWLVEQANKLTEKPYE